MQSLYRIWAILAKELIQMRRDKMTFAMMLGIPIMQLILFGYVINNNPKQLPAAIYAEENTQITRTLIQGFENADYYRFDYQLGSLDEGEALIKSGKVAFVITIQQGFTKKLLRGERPQLLIQADASDPSSASNAISFASQIVSSALQQELKGPLRYLSQTQSPVDVVIHRQYNPESITHYNIVPGLLGVILTMTSVMITSMAMTRESERGNLENILAMPSKPHEVMLGKITPYVIVGLVQTIIILLAAKYLFTVPFLGSFGLLIISVFLFLVANLCLGFTFSTIAKTQMQAMQMTFFFFLPSILLSGFMFPFRGMPDWAQVLGEVLPLTHFLRIVRGIMLKGAELSHLQNEFYAIFVFITVVGTLAILRYRTTLD